MMYPLMFALVLVAAPALAESHKDYDNIPERARREERDEAAPPVEVTRPSAAKNPDTMDLHTIPARRPYRRTEPELWSPLWGSHKTWWLY